MLYRCFIIIAFFFLGDCFGQDFYVFDKDLNKIIADRNNSAPILFSVNTIKGKQKIVNKKITTQAYKDANTNLLKALKDSLATAKLYKQKIQKYDTYDEIAKILNDFLSSKKPFELKKNKLKTAQTLALTNHSNFLIYADSKINTKNKSKFFIISRNSLDLKIHLKRIIWKLNILKSQKPTLEATPFDSSKKLDEAREKLKTTKKHEYIKIPTNTFKNDQLVLGNETIDPVNNIVGVYKNWGARFVILKNNQEKVITPKEAEKHLERGGDFVFTDVTFLIENESTRDKVLVTEGFLNQYSVNSFANNERFLNKDLLSIREYSDPIEKKIDSIVLSYLE